jgi:hypothetical protein
MSMAAPLFSKDSANRGAAPHPFHADNVTEKSNRGACYPLETIRDVLTEVCFRKM